jgi:hypothetical protein
MPQRIFLSYRREDAAASAGRLRDALAREFGERNIFQDVVAVRPGEDFTDAIERALSYSDVVLAVIGRNWLTDRLEAPGDYVRAELAAAISRAKQLIPVLVGGATMPAAERLPEDLRPLALRQAVVLHDATWHRDVAELISILRGGIASAGRRRRVATAAAAIVAGAVAAGGTATWLILDDDRQRGEAAETTGTGGAGAGAAIQRCTTPRTPEWTPLGVSGDTDVGDPAALHVEVIEGSTRADGSRHYIVLRTKTTNLVEVSETHYVGYYKLSAEGKTFAPYCFVVVAGQDPITPGGTSTALVGFDTTVDPSNGFTLDLDHFGDIGRIELAPTSD